MIIWYYDDIVFQKQTKDNMQIENNTLKLDFKKPSHEIDIETYIATLRSLSVIAKEVNYKVHQSSDVQLRVVAQKEGSFESIIEFLQVGAPIVIAHLPSIVDTINIVIELYKLKKIIGDISNAQTEDVGDDRVKVSNSNMAMDNSVIVNNTTYNIYSNNQTVQDAMAGTFKKATEDESLEAIELSSSDMEVDFSRESFKDLSKKIAIEYEPLENEVKPVTLVVVKPILEKSKNKWTFIKDGYTIQADIDDQDFLDDVVNRVHSFAAGDRLMVELLTRNEYNKQLLINMPKSYTVLKVKNYVSGDEATQMKMI